jgi:hypothetical protein
VAGAGEPGRDLGAGADAEFGHDVLGVGLGGPRGDSQPEGDIAAGEALGDQLADLCLPAGEPVMPRTCGGCGRSPEGWSPGRRFQQRDLDDFCFRHDPAGFPQCGEPSVAQSVAGRGDGLAVRVQPVHVPDFAGDLFDRVGSAEQQCGAGGLTGAGVRDADDLEVQRDARPV